MDAAFGQLQVLLDLEARHDDLLRRLDELEHRVADVLAEYQPPPRQGETPRCVRNPPRDTGDENQGLRDAA